MTALLVDRLFCNVLQVSDMRFVCSQFALQVKTPNFQTGQKERTLSDAVLTVCCSAGEVNSAVFYVGCIVLYPVLQPAVRQTQSMKVKFVVDSQKEGPFSRNELFDSSLLFSALGNNSLCPGTTRYNSKPSPD